MGSDFRKTTTRPIPAGATVAGQGSNRTARWKTRQGRTTAAAIVTLDDGRDVIRQESSTYFAKYRDGDGTVHVVPTKCRDESAARQILRELEKTAERVRSGVVTTQELAVAERKSEAIARTIADYIGTLTGSKSHRENTRRYLERLAEDLHWHRPADLRRDDLERWLADQTRLKRSARSRNAFQTAANALGNWCVRSGRMSSNPFDRLPKANLDADRRRQRRALTTDELHRLVTAAREAPERPPTRQREGGGARPPQRLTGAERAEIYAILAGTGLRIGELGELTVADFRLDDPVPPHRPARPRHEEPRGRHHPAPRRPSRPAAPPVHGSDSLFNPLRNPGRLNQAVRRRLPQGRHPEARRSRSHGRHPCVEDDFRDLASPVRRLPPNRASPHAALGHQADDVGLHRS